MAMHGPKTEAENMEMSTDESAVVDAPTLKDHYHALPAEYKQTEAELLANYETPQWSPNAYFAERRGIEATPEEQEAHKAQFLNTQMQKAITRFQQQDPFYLAEQAHQARGQRPAPTASQRAALLRDMPHGQLSALLHEKLTHQQPAAPTLDSASSSAKDLFKQAGSYAPQSARMMLFNDALSTQLTKGHTLGPETEDKASKLTAKMQAENKHRAQIRNQEIPYAQVAAMSISDDASASAASSSSWQKVGRRGKPRK